LILVRERPGHSFHNDHPCIHDTFNFLPVCHFLKAIKPPDITPP
jgi:hypothetical protein